LVDEKGNSYISKYEIIGRDLKEKRTAMSRKMSIIKNLGRRSTRGNQEDSFEEEGEEDVPLLNEIPDPNALSLSILGKGKKKLIGISNFKEPSLTRH
jgi:hypothetical protein